MNSNYRLSFAQNFEETPSHQRSMMPNNVSIFNQTTESGISMKNNKTLEGNSNSEVKLNRLGKIINRHRRIESVINKIDPFETNNKRTVVDYDSLI